MRLPAFLVLISLAAPVSAQTTAASGEQILLDRLIGVDLVAAPDARVPGPGVDLAVPVPDADALRSALAPALDQPASFESLNRLVDLVRAHFADEGQPFTLVSLPEQDITDGEVRILVTPSRLDGPVRVRGAHHFSEAAYRDGIPVADGVVIDADAVAAEVDRLSANPFRDVRVVTTPGDRPATTALTLEVEDRRPIEGRLVLEAATDDDPKVSAGVTWGDLFGRGDLLSYDVSGTPGEASSLAHNLSMRQFWTGERVFTATLSHTNPTSGIAGAFEQETQTTALALDLSMPLPSDIDGRWRVGVEAATETSDLRFGETSVDGSDVTRVAFSIGADRATTLGETRIAYGADLVLSPGGLAPRNTDAAFAELREGAESRYAILRARGSLDRRIGAGLRWSTTAAAQLASGPLIASQQFDAFGGAGLRIGSATLTGDEGLGLRNTLRLPSDGIPFAPFLFADGAVVSLADGDESRASIAAIGVGFDRRVGDGGTVTLQAGRLFGDVPEGAEVNSLNATLSWTF